MFSAQRHPLIANSVRLVSPTTKRHHELRGKATDVLTICKEIITKIDRFDAWKILGPALPELNLTGNNQLILFLLLEKKQVMMQEVISQRETAGFRSIQNSNETRKAGLKSRGTSMNAVGALKKTIYAAHFVQDEIAAKVDGMLSAVAQMSVIVKSSLPPHFPKAKTPSEIEEINYLRHEQITKKQLSPSPIPAKSHSKSPHFKI